LVQRCLILVGPQYGPRILSLVRCLEFSRGSQISGKSVHPCYRQPYLWALENPNETNEPQFQHMFVNRPCGITDVVLRALFTFKYHLTMESLCSFGLTYRQISGVCLQSLV